MIVKVHTFTVIFLIIFTSPCHAENYRMRLHQLETDTIQENDISAEIYFGRQVAARLLNIEKLSINKRLTRYLNLIGTYLVMHSARSDIQFHFAVLDSDIVNAYSAPGGYVFVTRAAIDNAQDEAELAAILAHEIAHINARHIVNELNIRGENNLNVTVFTRLLGASADSTRIAVSQAVDSALQVLLKDGYKLHDEIEADRLAIHMLAESGYDPTALLRYINRISKLRSINSTGSSPTHPTPAQRKEILKTILEDEKLVNQPFPIFKSRFEQHVIQE